VNRVTLVCDFSHNQPSEIAVEIEAVLDSRVQAGLRKNAMFATCQLRPSALLAGDGRRVRSGMPSERSLADSTSDNDGIRQVENKHGQQKHCLTGLTVLLPVVSLLNCCLPACS
jgi:hypothetical protein